MVESASESLPPNGGNYEKPKSKSTDRHRRETAFKIASQVQLSVTTMRRGQFILEYGSPEIQQSLEAGKISISRAYNIVKAEDEEKGRLFLCELSKLSEEERKKLMEKLEHG